uniref:Histone-lysine N-methyltransferase family member SUVH9-like n=1 Tax=Tanacetum cinerariifolium TaxID=118510 RepID=A0A699KCH3_TANCI|nr:histone-lysine N-methyltransferase family member SUVH9-like [Tanacetum cinerariifolium]
MHTYLHRQIPPFVLLMHQLSRMLILPTVRGRYEDDEDASDVIVYTRHDGHDKPLRQVVHQKLEGGNLVMERSMHYGIELRVIWGFSYEGSASGTVYVTMGCIRLSRRGLMLKNGGEFSYDENGLLVRGKQLIFECGPHCRCPPDYQN